MKMKMKMMNVGMIMRNMKMTRKYYGWIAYEDVHGCHEEGVTEETLEEFEEKYGRIVDSGGEIVSVHVYLVKDE